MKNKKLIILFAMIFTFIIFAFLFKAQALEAKVSIETEKNTRITTVKIDADKKMNVVKFYKKAENGKYILFYIAKPESNSLECKLKSIFFSEESETDLKIVVEDDEGRTVLDQKVSKLPEMPTINPEETEKPSWSPSTLPTKPTPSPSTSTSASTSPSASESSSPSETSAPEESTNPSDGGTKITAIKLSKNSVKLKVGETEKVTYTVTPEGAHERLIWRTNDSDICTIAADGTITAKSGGTTEISIRTESGVKDTCEVTVTSDVDELRNKLVETAKKEVGNTNGQKYLDYFHTTSAPGGWCSEFASWCAYKCGYVDKGIIPKKDGCGEFSKWFKNKGRFKDRNYIPKPGDICFTGGDDVSHTCIVVGVDEEKGKFYTVDGGSKVTKNTRTLKSSNIYGFGVPDYESIAE